MRATKKRKLGATIDLVAQLTYTKMEGIRTVNRRRESWWRSHRCAMLIHEFDRMTPVWRCTDDWWKFQFEKKAFETDESIFRRIRTPARPWFTQASLLYKARQLGLDRERAEGESHDFNALLAFVTQSYDALRRMQGVKAEADPTKESVRLLAYIVCYISTGTYREIFPPHEAGMEAPAEARRMAAAISGYLLTDQAPRLPPRLTLFRALKVNENQRRKLKTNTETALAASRLCMWTSDGPQSWSPFPTPFINRANRVLLVAEVPGGTPGIYVGFHEDVIADTKIDGGKKILTTDWFNPGWDEFEVVLPGAPYGFLVHSWFDTHTSDHYPLTVVKGTIINMNNMPSPQESCSSIILPPQRGEPSPERDETWLNEDFVASMMDDVPGVSPAPPNNLKAAVACGRRGFAKQLRGHSRALVLGIFADSHTTQRFENYFANTMANAPTRQFNPRVAWHRGPRISLDFNLVVYDSLGGRYPLYSGPPVHFGDIKYIPVHAENISIYKQVCERVPADKSPSQWARLNLEWTRSPSCELRVVVGKIKYDVNKYPQDLQFVYLKLNEYCYIQPVGNLSFLYMAFHCPVPVLDAHCTGIRTDTDIITFHVADSTERMSIYPFFGGGPSGGKYRQGIVLLAKRAARVILDAQKSDAALVEYSSDEDGRWSDDSLTELP